MKLKCAIIYKLNNMPVITTFNWTILTCFNMCVIYTSVSSIMLVRPHFGLKRLAYFFKVINAIYWPSNTNTTMSDYSTAYLLNKWISITKTGYIRIYIYIYIYIYTWAKAKLNLLFRCQVILSLTYVAAHGQVLVTNRDKT